MRGPVWLLTVALVCMFPSHAMANSHRLGSYAQPSSSCGKEVHGDDGTVSRAMKCTAGVALNVSRNGMKLRPAHGNPLRVRFTSATVFESDSGEGVLDGLVSGDYVCVGYKLHAGTVTALFVAFDPKTTPCGSNTRLGS